MFYYVIVYTIVHPQHHIVQPPFLLVSAIFLIVGEQYCVLMFLVVTETDVK